MTEEERADLLSQIASELVGYAEDIVLVDDKREKVEFITEVFSEGLLGLLKVYLIMNPHVHYSQLVDDLADEMEQRLSISFGDKEFLKILN